MMLGSTPKTVAVWAYASDVRDGIENNYKNSFKG